MANGGLKEGIGLAMAAALAGLAMAASLASLTLLAASAGLGTPWRHCWWTLRIGAVALAALLLAVAVAVAGLEPGLDTAGLDLLLLEA